MRQLLRKSSFGYAWALNGVGQLGTISAVQQDSAAQITEAAFRTLDEAARRLNEARQSGVSTSRIEEFSIALATTRQELDTLNAQLDSLEEADFASWQERAFALAGQAETNLSDIRSELSGFFTSSTYRIALWSGVAVLGAIGAAVIIRQVAFRQRGRRRTFWKNRGRWWR